jgi:hypothetical protein
MRRGTVYTIVLIAVMPALDTILARFEVVAASMMLSHKHRNLRRATATGSS